MGTGRLEAFSDGVIAIIITIMVLELKPPAHEAGLSGLRPLIPALISYVLSFLYVGIYWNNHHHLLHAAKHVSGPALWANLHLLFWLSLVPFVTSWNGETGFAPIPAAAYGVVLLMAGIAWQLLEAALLHRDGADSTLGAAIGRDRKEWVSVGAYVLGVAVAVAGRVFAPDSGWPGLAAWALYVLVAALWFIPDKRIERAIEEANEET